MVTINLDELASNQTEVDTDLLDIFQKFMHTNLGNTIKDEEDVTQGGNADVHIEDDNERLADNKVPSDDPNE